MNHKLNKIKYSGVPLIETLLYLALTSMMLIVITDSFNNYLKTRTRAMVRNEVEAQKSFITDRLEYYLQNADSVTTPVNQGNSTSITFLGDGQASTTTISLIGDQLVATLPGGTTENLSTNRVAISNLQFVNGGVTGKQPMITFTFTISYKGGQGAEYNYSNTVKSGILVSNY